MKKISIRLLEELQMKKILCFILIYVMLSSINMVFAMPTSTFDKGMEKGISYFNRGMYYEAKDEFQWFCDYNWGAMNYGQQQYALDYLDGTKAKVQQLENKNTSTPSKSSSSSSSVPKKTYSKYSGTNIPMYESVIGGSECDREYFNFGSIHVVKHIYFSNDRPENAIKYGKALEEHGFTYRGLSSSDGYMGGFGIDYDYYDDKNFVTIHYTKTFITVRIQDR